MSNQQNIFVFVVCGAKVHTQTLHFSLARLKKFSSCKIIVVTDTTRNEEIIQHDHILDVPAPEWMDNHQAAIWLKTGLHRLLPEGPMYCYLDTDVVAIRPGVDQIFEHFNAPISFCTDHCRLKAFSPAAVHDEKCDRMPAKQQRLMRLYYQFKQEDEAQLQAAGPHVAQVNALKKKFHKKRPLHSYAIKDLMDKPSLLIKAIFQKVAFKFIQLAGIAGAKKDRLQRLEKYHRYLFGLPLSFDLFIAEEGYRFESSTASWYTLDGQFLFEEDYIVRHITMASPFRWEAKNQVWLDENGEAFSPIESEKLHRHILEKFGVHIAEPNWRHWNGGVFLFDRRSHEFMEQWRQWTLDIFHDPVWKTRDQGTLAAVTWYFGLQYHPTLPIKYNFIADYYHPDMVYMGQLQFSLKVFQEPVSPLFLHIYHHFGDESWEVWRDVKNLMLNA